MGSKGGGAGGDTGADHRPAKTDFERDPAHKVIEEELYPVRPLACPAGVAGDRLTT
jgi:hypothetical protein